MTQDCSKPHIQVYLIIFTFLFSLPAYAALCYVKEESSGANNGSSWADAYQKGSGLQTALGNSSCTEIWVAKGTYQPGASQTDSFKLKSGVALYGGFSGNETLLSQRNWVTHVTVLSGNNNNYNVVSGYGTNNTSILDGFTISDGYDTRNSTLSSLCTAFFCGGSGMRNDPGSPTLRNVIFENNTAIQSGGGMLNYNSSPILINVLFKNNKAAIGGGLYNHGGSKPTLINTTFVKNSATASVTSPATSNGGAIFNSNRVRSGGLWVCQTSDPIISNSIISGNTGVGTTIANNGGSCGSGSDLVSSPTVSHSLLEGTTLPVGTIDGGNNILNLDPIFTSSSDFHLQANSPAIDRGDNGVVTATTDLDGATRIQGSIVDIGAYEFSPVLNIIADSTIPNETGPLSGSFTITRTGNLSNFLSVSYVVSGTASSGIDYSPFGTLSFAPNVATTILTLNTLDDNDLDPNETVTITLTIPSGYTSTSNSATLTITDNELPLVISEIMYDPNGNESTSNYDWEWLEVYNPNSVAINLTGYVIDDNNDSVLMSSNIPNGSSIPAKGSAILFNAQSNTMTAFKAVWGSNINLIGVNNWTTTLKLGNSGNQIGLWNSITSYNSKNFANVIDEVSYNNGSGWPNSDDQGSIYLKDLNTGNHLGSNWALSTSGTVTPVNTTYQSKTRQDLGSPSQPYTLTLTVVGGGTVTGDINCAGTCSRLYPPILPTSGSLTATPNVGYLPVVWSGGCSASFSITNDMSCTASFTKDTIPPETNLLTYPASTTNTASASFSFNGTDNDTPSANLAFECQLDNGSWSSCSSPQIYPNLGEGSHTFQVRAKDNSNNVDDTPESYSWNIDTIPPVVTINTQPPVLTNNTSANFTFSALDNVTPTAELTFKCQLDGGGWNGCSSPQNYPNLAGGTHSFQVYAEDGINNRGIDESYSWTIDDQIPTVTINNAPPTPSNSSSATFVFSGSDNLTSSNQLLFECQLDSGSWSVCNHSQTYGPLSHGAHTLTVRTKDEAGNISLNASHPWTIDPSAPTVIIDSAPTLLTNSSAAIFVFHGTDDSTPSNLLILECQLDNGGWNECSSPFTLPSLSENTHTFQVRAKDPANNIGGITSYTWKIDTTSPTVTITQALDQSDPTDSLPIHFIATFNEEITGLTSSEVSVNPVGASVTLTGGPFVYNIIIDHVTSTGLVQVTIPAGVANDLVGNPNLSSIHTDNTVSYQLAPQVSMIKRDGTEVTQANTVTYTVSFSEPVTGVSLDDFLLSTTGLSNAQIISVTGSDSTYIVTVNTGSGEGSLSLVLQDNDSIRNASSVPLQGLGISPPRIGETYLIKRGSLTATILPVFGKAESITIVFSDPVMGFDLSDLSLTYNGGNNLLTSAQSLSSEDSITWKLGNVTLLTQGLGQYTLTLIPNGSIMDQAHRILIHGAEQKWSVAPPSQDPPASSAFAPPHFTLWVSVEGKGQGRVRSSPSGIECDHTDEECQHTYATFSEVELTPIAEPGSVFSSWGGHQDCAQGKVFMDSSKLCMAFFRKQPHTLTIVPSPYGTVTSQPQGIQCTSQSDQCYAEFDPEQEVTLFVFPHPNWQWTGWRGACNAQGKITLTEDSQCEPLFEPIPPPSLSSTLNVKAIHGKVISNPGGIDCGKRCTAQFPQHSDITLMAFAEEGYQLMYWSGQCQGTKTASTFTILETETSCEAHFEALPPILPDEVLQPTPEPMPEVEEPSGIPIEIIEEPPPSSPSIEDNIVENNVLETDSKKPPEPKKPCPPTEGQLHWICHAQWHTIKGDLEIGARGNLSHAKLEGMVNNRGWISNSLLLPQGVIEGGVLTGYITNQGLITDFEFNGALLRGGLLAGVIVNNSRIGGYFEDVQLAAETVILGGKLAGHIIGDADQPAYLEDLKILPGSVLNHVKLGKGVTLKGKVLLGQGTQLLYPPKIEKGEEFLLAR